MVQRFLLITLFMSMIWMGLPPAWAGDAPKKSPTQSTVAQMPSREELDVIAVMEILKAMDMVEAMDILEDLDVLTKEETDDQHD